MVSEGLRSEGHLIIVDDAPVILDMLETLFGGRYELSTFDTGAEALAHMEAHGVDVLLTDKNLPDIGGLELLAHAKRITPDCEVLLITGYASLETALEALKHGAFDYIVKPPKTIFEVRRKVEQAFQKLYMTRENRRLLYDLRAKNLELEQALEQVKKVQAELIQSEKLAGIGTLAAGIAHEISSPLFGVMGLAEAIAEEQELSVVHDYAAEIVQYSISIKEIVVQLSGYSRSAEREYLTTIDSAQVVADAVRLVARSLGLADDVVQTDTAPELLFQARTSEIQQVLVNLVKNAVEEVSEHRPDGTGRVWVETFEDDEDVVLRVRDNGAGIPEHDRKNIFDPFYTTKAPGRGTGLGLNIVYRIVTKYRGTVSVSGAPGGGAVFTVRFPGADTSA
jgi:C4-dicarboxylate-specific signal transduction histidine kinase